MFFPWRLYFRGSASLASCVPHKYSQRDVSKCWLSRSVPKQSTQHTMTPPSKGLNPSEIPKGKTTRLQLCGPTRTHHLAWPGTQSFILRMKQNHTLQHPLLVPGCHWHKLTVLLFAERARAGDTPQRQSWSFQVYPLVSFPTGWLLTAASLCPILTVMFHTLPL